MQIVGIPTSADNLWTITAPIKKKLKEDLQYIAANHDTSKFALLLEFTFTRRFPQTFPDSKIEESIPLSADHATALISMIFEDSLNSIVTEEDFEPIIRLPSSGDSIQPTLV